VTVDPDGLLRIAGAQVALGYRDGRSAGLWSVGPDGVRTFTTADQGRVGPDGRVEVTGRADDVVQVGGTSVSLAAVRRALLADPRVAEAEAVAVPDPTWGTRIVAFVVPSPTAGSDERLADGLPAAVRAALGGAAAPREVQVVPELPTLASGKADRRALRERAATAAPAPGGSR
jgi:O-succinylbenzoic acid--CoA ligase